MTFQGDKTNNSSNRGKIADALTGFMWSLKRAVFHNSILNKTTGSNNNSASNVVTSTPSHVAKCE